MYVYARYCPVAATTQVVGDYWTPLIVRELLYGTDRFNQLVRNLPAISRTLLAARLRALEKAGVVICRRDVKNVTSYQLTESGRALGPVIDAMSTWGARWGRSDDELAEIEPRLVICMLKDRMRTSELPERRVVIEVTSIAEPGVREERAWLVCERRGVSMCFDPPGFEVDLWMRGAVSTLYAIWRERCTMGQALRGGKVKVDGPRALTEAVPRWFDGAGELEAASRSGRPTAAAVD